MNYLVNKNKFILQTKNSTLVRLSPLYRSSVSYSG
jgi:hypothetical protein